AALQRDGGGGAGQTVAKSGGRGHRALVYGDGDAGRRRSAVRTGMKTQRRTSNLRMRKSPSGLSCSRLGTFYDGSGNFAKRRSDASEGVQHPVLALVQAAEAFALREAHEIDAEEIRAVGNMH